MQAHSPEGSSTTEGQAWLPFHPPRKIPRVRRYAMKRNPRTLPGDESAKESGQFQTSDYSWFSSRVWLQPRRSIPGSFEAKAGGLIRRPIWRVSARFSGF